jgi:O-antigen ligase
MKNRRERLVNSKKIALILTILALIIIPLISSRQIFSFFDLTKTIVLYFMASLLVGLYLYRDAPERNGGLLGKYLLLYFVWLLLCALLSPNLSLAFFGGYSRYEGLFFFIASGFFFFIGNWLREYKRQLSLVLVLTGAVVGALAVWEYWDGCRLYPLRVCSTFGNPMLLATYFVLIIPVGWGLIWTENNCRLKLAGYAAIALMIMGNVFTFSRGGWGGFLLTGLIFLILCFRSIRRRPAILIPVFLITVLSIFVSVLMVKYQPGQVTIKNPERLNVMVKQPVKDPSRLILIKTALDVFKENPLFGVGINGFATAVTKYLPVELVRMVPLNLNFDMVHNDLLQTLATQGMLGLAVFLGLLGILFAQWKQWNATPEKDPLDAGLWAALIGHLILIQFSFPWVGYTFIFWLIIGMAIPAPPHRTVGRKQFPRPLRLTFAALLVIFSLGYAVLAYRADTIFCRGYLERQNLWKYEKRLAAATRLAPWEAEYHFIRAHNAYLILNEPKTTKEQHIKMSKILTAEIFPLLENQPNNYKYYLFLGDVFDFYGKTKLAEEHYRKALRLYPNYYPIYLAMGGLMVRTNRNREAETCFKRALAINPDYTEARDKLEKLKAIRR